MPHFTDFESFLNGDIKGKKIGIPREYRLDGMSNEIEKLWSDGMKMLEEAGLVENKDGQLSLTPKAIRKLGQNALGDLYRQLSPSCNYTIVISQKAIPHKEKTKKLRKCKFFRIYLEEVNVRRCSTKSTSR